MSVNIGPKIGIDGEAEYRKQINNIIQQAKTLDSEMKATTAAFKENTTAEEKNQAVSKILTQQLEVQQKRVAELSNMLSKATDKFGENATQTLRWEEALNEAKAQTSLIEKKIDSLGAELVDMSDKFDEGQKQALKFSDVLKGNLFSDVIISAAKKLGETLNSLKDDMIEAAAAMKAQASQFEQTFGGMGDGATQFGDEAAAAIKAVSEESKIFESRLKGAATGIYAFARASGATEQESLALMAPALKAAADNAAYMDKTLEEVSETLQSFLKGNYANDAALGVSATEYTRNAKAVELFGKKFNELSEYQKQQTLLQMVIDAQKLSGAYGQASRESSEWANVQGNLNAVWQQFLAKVGTPVLENLIPIIQKVTASLQEWTENFDWEGFNLKINSFVTFLTENGPGIIAVITGIGAGFATWNIITMVQGVVSAIRTFMLANQGLSLAAAAAKAAIAAMGGPITVLVTVIGAAVAALITFWNTNEEFRTFVTDCFNSIVETITGIVDTIKTTFTNLVESAFNWGKDFIQGIINGIKSMISRVKETVSNVAATIRSYLHFSRPDTGPLREYEEWMPDFMQGLAKGIKNNQHLVKEAVSGLASDMVMNVRPVQSAGVYSSGRQGNINNITITVQTSSDADGYQIADIINRKLGELLV